MKMVIHDQGGLYLRGARSKSPNGVSSGCEVFLGDESRSMDLYMLIYLAGWELLHVPRWASCAGRSGVRCTQVRPGPSRPVDVQENKQLLALAQYLWLLCSPPRCEERLHQASRQRKAGCIAQAGRGGRLKFRVHTVCLCEEGHVRLGSSNSRRLRER